MMMMVLVSKQHDITT